MKLYCCLCLHVLSGVAAEADTIMNGQAVCYDHMGFVQGGQFSTALRTLKNEIKEREKIQRKTVV